MLLDSNSRRWKSPNLRHVEQNSKSHRYVNRRLMLNEDINEEFLCFRFTAEGYAVHDVPIPAPKGCPGMKLLVICAS